MRDWLQTYLVYVCLEMVHSAAERAKGVGGRGLSGGPGLDLGLVGLAEAERELCQRAEAYRQHLVTTLHHLRLQLGSFIN